MNKLYLHKIGPDKSVQNAQNKEHFILFKKIFILKKYYNRKVIIKRLQNSYKKETQKILKKKKKNSYALACYTKYRTGFSLIGRPLTQIYILNNFVCLLRETYRSVTYRHSFS